MDDLISRQAVLDVLKKISFSHWFECGEYLSEDTREIEIISSNKALEVIEALPSAQPEQRWIPIKWHDCTDEDREKYGFNNDIAAVFDCEMPDDNQSILVTTSHGYINQDVCYIEDIYSLDSGWDWIDDIKAWMPLPEPWRGDENGR